LSALGSHDKPLRVFAEFERDLIRERVWAGLENARRKGKRPGRRPYFDMTSLGTLGRLRNRGMSVRAIAREMKVSKSLVHNSLKFLNSKVNALRVLHEPPYAERHVRWCGRLGAVRPPAYPIVGPEWLKCGSPGFGTGAMTSKAFKGFCPLRAFPVCVGGQYLCRGCRDRIPDGIRRRRLTGHVDAAIFLSRYNTQIGA
jgi:hypothetical protein